MRKLSVTRRVHLKKRREHVFAWETQTADNTKFGHEGEENCIMLSGE